MPKNEVGPIFYYSKRQTNKKNYKWVKNLNVRSETIKFLEETQRKSLSRTKSWQNLVMTPKAQATKKK